MPFNPASVSLWYNSVSGGSTSVTHDNVGVSGPPWTVLSVTSTPGGSSLRTNLWSFNVPPANGNPFNTGTLTLSALPSPLQPTDSTLLKLIRCGGTVAVQVQFTNADGTPNPIPEVLLVTLRC